VAALVLYLVVVVITVAINIPLNDGIKAAGTPNTLSGFSEIRQQFHESRWVRGNLVRWC